MEGLTLRDREYLRALFLLNSHEEPVGPTELSEIMRVSKVGALQKMKHLDSIDMGEYIKGSGLLLNKKGVEIVEEDIRNHHIFEQFLRKSLGMNYNDACQESEKISSVVSNRLIEKIVVKFEGELNCECGNCMDPPYNPEELRECHWCKKLIDHNIGDLGD